MEVEGNESTAGQIDLSVPIGGRQVVTTEAEVEMPFERTEGFHLFSDVPPAPITKRFKEF